MVFSYEDSVEKKMANFQDSIDTEFNGSMIYVLAL